MTPNITSLLLVGLNAEATALATAAARQLFPDATVTEVASLEAAQARAGAAGTELLLLGDGAAAGGVQAVATNDARGLPRWPVIVFGPEPASPSHLPPEDWNLRATTRIFQTAIAAHTQARDNARLRGDLFTIGRRLSHDLRTPMMGIATGCDAIRETAPEDAASREVFVRSIARSSEEIGALIDRVGGLLKATAEPKAKEAVPMGNVLWAALQRLERRRLEQRAVVEQPADWPTVPGVPAWLELIWGNLVANALEHAGKEPRIELGWAREPGGWRFWAEDRGPGVAPRLVGGLFQPFDLLHRANAPHGWGLPIVQRLVELQGGRCGYEARAGGGARFSFTLPG